MKDVDAGWRRRAVAAHQTVREQRQRRRQRAFHAVIDGDHVIIIDRQLAAECQAVAIFPGQRHRRSRRKDHRARGPDTIRFRHWLGGICRSPAEFCEERRHGARLQKKLDIFRIRILGLLISLEHDVVDPETGERNRA